jgi:hypothetical protein
MPGKGTIMKMTTQDPADQIGWIGPQERVDVGTVGEWIRQTLSRQLTDGGSQGPYLTTVDSDNRSAEQISMRRAGSEAIELQVRTSDSSVFNVCVTRAA